MWKFVDGREKRRAPVITVGAHEDIEERPKLLRISLLSLSIFAANVVKI